jgi:hypothetical protein
MQAAVARFPADLALRRQLWRQWVRLDPPQGDRGRAMPPRARSTRTSQILLPKIRSTGRKALDTNLRLVRRTVRPAPTRSIGTLVAWCVGLEAVITVGVAVWLRS